MPSKRIDLICRYCEEPMKCSPKEFSTLAHEAFDRGEEVPTGVCKKCRKLMPYIERVEQVVADKSVSVRKKKKEKEKQ